jgi:hypothetical protein
MSAVFKVPTPMRELNESNHLWGKDGRGGRFRVDERSYRRGLDGKEVALDYFTTKFQVGDEVLVGTEGDRVAIIRPVH